MRGPFIVIDGTDGSGKTVQANRLIERLREGGRPAELTDFPRYGKPSGWFVEEYLAGRFGGAEEVGAYRASTFFALDRYAASFGMREKLEQGTALVSNRYVSANKGHQMGKIADPDEQVRFLEWLNGFEYGLMGIPKPDLTIFLHVPAEIGYAISNERDQGKKDIHQQDLKHLQAAEQAFLRLQEIDREENWRVVECALPDWRETERPPRNQLKPIEEIHEEVWRLVQDACRTE